MRVLRLSSSAVAGLVATACVLMPYAVSAVPGSDVILSDGIVEECVNRIDDSLMNRCLMQNPPGFLTLIGHVVNDWVNPRVCAIAAMLAVLALPFLTLDNATACSADHRRHFYSVRLVLLNFLHRLGFALVLDVGLYSLFRQYRPCDCGDATAHYSVYGMPSGDAMTGGLVGAFLFDEGARTPMPGFFKASGLLVVLGKCVERTALGYHSLGQVTVGALLGIFLHYYSTRAPQYTVVIDDIVQIAAGFALLGTDDSLDFKPGTHNNLFSWLVWGIGVQLFSTLLLLRTFSTNSAMADLAKSYSSLRRYGFGSAFDSDMLAPLMSSEAETLTSEQIHSGKRFLSVADWPVTVLVFALSLVVFLISTGIGQFAWIR